MDLNQITLPCKDYAASVAFYSQLGLRQIVDSPPRYARFETDRGTTLSIHTSKIGSGEFGAIIYFEVDDVDREVQRLSEFGIHFDSEPADKDWLWREAHLRDPTGNRLCIFHAGENRRFPPWRISEGAR